MTEIKNLTHSYGKFVALDDVSFEINSGDFIGLIGPNGAGKTTLMNTMVGILAADKGEVVMNGFRLFGAQSLISMGSTFIPIPGAMGYTDLMMLNGFSAIMPEADAAVLELLSRSTSFYCCVILCFIVVAVSFFIGKRRSDGDI